MVDADFAGLMLTADPVTGDRGKIVVESTPGLGEGVVSGMVTADRAIIDAEGKIIERRAGLAGAVIKLNTGGGSRRETPEHNLQLPEAMLREISKAGG